MSSNFATTVDVIEHLGGNTKVAVMLDTTDKAVANWRYSGLFPANTYLALCEALGNAKERAPDSLWAMRPLIKRRKKRK